MRVKKCWVMLMALVCVPLLSHAAEVKLTSSTQYLWYQDFVADKGQDEIAQYLRLNVTKLDKEGKINFYSYGRVTKQVSSSEDVQGRLYYAYVDYRDVVQDHLDLKAGRTFVNAAAVSGTMDGLHLNFKNWGPVGFTVFGGREVIFQDKKEIGGGNALAGGSIYLDTVKNTHVEVSYGKTYRDSQVARENVGLDFSTTPFEIINFYGRAKYDTKAERYNELLFGATLAPFKDLILRGEYYQSYATFDAASIYTIFAVDKYQEKSISAEYFLTKDYRISVKYAKEDFSGDATADVYKVGLLAKPIKDLTLNVSFEKRNGYAGQLSGIRLYGEYKINKAAILAGIDYDDFRREASREGSAKKYWAGINYQFTKIMSAVVRVEQNYDYNYNNSYQGQTSINVNY
jgi:hypothetical protein